jgi:hypothetical protein
MIDLSLKILLVQPCIESEDSHVRSVQIIGEQEFYASQKKGDC